MNFQKRLAYTPDFIGPFDRSSERNSHYFPRSSGRPLTILLFSIILFVVGVPSVQGQIISPFTSIYSTSTQGNIAIIGNSSMTCPGGGACATAQGGGSAQNNSFNMVNIDIDGIGGTTNSTSASFTLPPGATVLWSGLFWGARSNSGSRNQVSFSTPASGYTTVTGALQSSGTFYGAYAVVTSQVQAGGSGTYTVANIQSTTGTNQFAGWSLVIVYQDATLPNRNLNVYNGYAFVNGSNPNITLNISGFVTPQVGPVRTLLGVVAYEGDYGFTGDQFSLNSTVLSNSLNGANDFYNSTITNLNSHVTTKNPNYVNQLGFDIDIVNADNIIPNAATSATLNLTTGGEEYLPGVVTTVIDLYSPDIDIIKTSSDINGGIVEPGDTLEFTISLTNNGDDGATMVALYDTIPTNTVYVPGSLNIVTGANSGSKTDASGDDQAEFDITGNRVIYRLGTGADATTGGILLPTAATSITFRARIDPATPNGTQIINRAVTTFNAQTLGTSLSAVSAPVDVVVLLPADLDISKTTPSSNVLIGQNATFNLMAKNFGPKDALDVSASDTLPAGMTYVSSVASQGSYDNSTGIWSMGALAFGDSATLSIVANMVTSGLKANIAGISASDVNDSVLTNNFDTAFVTGIVSVDFSNSEKNFSDINGGTTNSGDTLLYTILVRNSGNTNATAIVVTDTVPAGVTAVPGTITGSGILLGNIITFAPFDLIIGDSLFLEFQVTIDTTIADSSSVTNVATIDGNSVIQIVNTSFLALNKPVMNFSKLSDNLTPLPGDTLTYTVSYSNTGTGDANLVVVTDSLPASITYIVNSITLNGNAKTDSSDGDEATISGTSLTVNIGTVKPGQSGLITYQTIVPLQTSAGTVIQNTARMNYQDDPGNIFPEIDAVSNITVFQIAGVSITPTLSAQTSTDSTTVDYPFVVTNTGNGNDGYNLSGVSTQNWNPAIYLDADRNGILDPSELSAGTVTVSSSIIADSSEYFIARITVPPSQLDNTIDTLSVTVTSQFNGGVSIGASYVTTISLADVNIVKNQNVSNPQPGQIVTYTLNYSNNGSSTALGTVITDAVDSNVTLVNGSITGGGSYDSGSRTITWNTGTIGGGQSGLVSFDVTVNAGLSAGSSILNMARVAYTDSIDGSSHTDSSNQTSGVVTLLPSLLVTVLPATQTQDAGLPVQYVLTVTNNGNGQDSVSMSDASSLGLTWVFYFDVNNDGLLDGGDSLANLSNLGTLSPGGSFNIIALDTLPRLTPDGSRDTTGFVFTSLSDNSTTGQTSTITIVRAPVMGVTKSVVVVGGGPSIPGATLRYTISYSNSGTGASTDVVINDIIPANTIYVTNSVLLNTVAKTDASDGDEVIVSGGQVIVTIGSLVGGGSGTINFDVVIQ